MAWLPLLHRADIVRRRAGHDFLKAFPKAKAWQGELAKTGLYEASVSKDFDDAFSAFYLSENTYLGRGENCPDAMGERRAGGCCG